MEDIRCYICGYPFVTDNDTITIRGRRTLCQRCVPKLTRCPKCSKETVYAKSTGTQPDQKVSRRTCIAEACKWQEPQPPQLICYMCNLPKTSGILFQGQLYCDSCNVCVHCSKRQRDTFTTRVTCYDCQPQAEAM